MLTLKPTSDFYNRALQEYDRVFSGDGAPRPIRTGMADPNACKQAFPNCPRCGHGTA